ncbi:hypothetical protein B0T24DRAFT_393263 [Lasiosphaeria ovina]|uniref:Uncharacterized protein n=1 Tax=Lasiosphaeria ovina TaxID=92902 RepID=A0AAE0JWD3_9PEZI|nr:hypothetical protein B0T24DRAFT_393263 [Lasiosphaeria ovina]
MDGHRALAAAQPRRLPFLPSQQPTFTVLRISSTAYADPIEETILGHENLEAWVSRHDYRPETPTDAEALVVGIKINIAPGPIWTFDIGETQFDNLFDRFAIEKTFRHGIMNLVDGFYPFVSETGNPAYSFYLRLTGMRFHLFWSSKPSAGSTRAILIFDPAHDRLGWSIYLKAYRKLVHHPLFPTFAALKYILTGNYGDLGDRMAKVVHVERQTSSAHSGGHNMLTLSQIISEASISTTNTSVGVGVADRIISYLETDSLELRKRGAGDQQTQYDDTWRDALEGIPILREELRSLLLIADGLDKRIQVQLSIIYNLIARADSQASLKLAKRAKEDSSSMKTVAIMTMAFLPATFFAALFAMPTLQWDTSQVVQDNFWVYLAFTLPSTALVFVIWGVVTQRQAIKDLVSFVFPQRKRNSDE